LEENENLPQTCNECSSLVQDDQRYCHNCGAYISSQAATVNIFNNASLRQIFAFYFIYLFICLLVKHTSWFNNYDNLFWIEIVLAIITLRFVWLNRREMKAIVKFQNFNWYVLLGVIGIAVAASCIVSLSVREVNVTFFNTDVSYFRAYRLYSYPTLIMIYSIALAPAMFEELAFRGVMYNHCASFLDERLVVAVTAFLFAIMHLSLLSLVWLIPFGFFIGNLRRRYNTVWYGIIFHFIFNLSACIMDLYRQGELLSYTF
jgi:membrane protease YdiL (CAAX protease family)